MRMAWLAVLAFALAGAAAAQPSGDLQGLPPVDPACVRANTPQSIMDAMVAAAPDTEGMQKALLAHSDVVLGIVRACGLPQDEKGGERLGAVEAAFALQDWSSGQLTGQFGVAPGRLEAAWSAIPPDTRKAFWVAAKTKSFPDDAMQALRGMAAALDVKGDDAGKALTFYAIARSYLERVRDRVE